MKKKIVILVVVLILLSGVGLYYINHYRPVPVLDSDKEVTYIVLKYETSRDESQEITNYDEGALLDCLNSCEMKWLQNGSYALGRGDRIEITIWETDGLTSTALFIYLGERSVVSVDNDWYEIVDGDKAYEAIMGLIRDKIQDPSD